MSLIYSSIACTLITLVCYQCFAWIQKKLNKVWLNPMLFSILVLILLSVIFQIDFKYYEESTLLLSSMLEPAVVALGFPLYQHLHTIKKQWKSIVVILSSGAIFIVAVTYVATILITEVPSLSVSLALKSITTPVAIAITEQLQGNNAITAFSIILAGLFGAVFGIKWLNFIKVTSPKAQGLAVGAASHALGTATISQISYQHAAYGSLALIYSATITAIISPSLILQLQRLFY